MIVGVSEVPGTELLLIISILTLIILLVTLILGQVGWVA